MKKGMVILLLLLMISLAWQEGKEIEKKGRQEQVSQEAERKGNPKKKYSFRKRKGTKEEIDLSLKPNEAGDIMVLMYHHIEGPERNLFRTPENFRRDLQTLYDEGYLPISLTDYVTGNITTPAGKTPYVLTFDDGRRNNFNYLEDGTIDPDCAVGIIMDFAEKYEDFEPRATFFLNGTECFGQPDLVGKKFDFLLDQGMEIGNHTRTHPNLKSCGCEELLEEIGGQKAYLEKFISSNYEINTLALPYGSRPEKDLYPYLKDGVYEGCAYHNIAIVNVGWDPNPSPYVTAFNPESIHRVTGSETEVDGVGLYDWIDMLKENPGRRFISDGVAEIVTVPQDKADQIKDLGEKEVYIYNLLEEG